MHVEGREEFFHDSETSSWEQKLASERRWNEVRRGRFEFRSLPPQSNPRQSSIGGLRTTFLNGSNLKLSIHTNFLLSSLTALIIVLDSHVNDFKIIDFSLLCFNVESRSVSSPAIAIFAFGRKMWKRLKGWKMKSGWKTAPRLQRERFPFDLAALVGGRRKKK